MSEKTQENVVEENPSAAEKETKVLKKIGADIGAESIAKVDLRNPKKEENPTEQNLESKGKEAPIEEVKQEEPEVQKNKPKEKEAVIEEVIEEVKEEPKSEIESDTKLESNQKQDQLVKDEKQPEMNIPEGILELVDFMNDTGGSMEDYIRLSKNYNKLDDTDLIKEFYKITKPHLDQSEIDFMIQDNFKYDNEIEEEVEIKRKQLAYKEELARAKTYLESQKEKYYKEVKPTSNLSKQQQRAIDFFNNHNNEQERLVQLQEKAANDYRSKTEQVFNDEFKGFDFNVDDKKFRLKIDANNAKSTQLDVNNVLGSYLNDDKSLKDGYGFHRALFAAGNADKIANHFYQLGKTEAIKEISAESKNINMDPRQTSTGYVESGGVKVRAIGGDDSSKLRIKLRDKK